jgi:hypothetical protein
MQKEPQINSASLAAELKSLQMMSASGPENS